MKLPQAPPPAPRPKKPPQIVPGATDIFRRLLGTAVIVPPKPAARRRPRGGETVLPAVHPNAGIAALYRKRLRALVEEMANSIEYWVAAQYRKNEPAVMALDATPAVELQRAIRKMTARWDARFDEASGELARWFAQSASRRSEATLKRILRNGGYSVRFKMTPAMRDVLDATVAENVALIKSIPQEYLTQVEGLVMRSVTTGRDVGQLTKDLRKRYDITDRRAALIARDQNNKATAVFTRVRQQEVGITEAIWLHSHGGKEPRKTHVANDGKRYDVAKGWFDPDPKVRKRIWPGELINCRCVAKSVVKGFS